MSFASLGLSEALAGAVEAAGYAQPTPVQQRAIPAVLQGRDLMVAGADISMSAGSGAPASSNMPAACRIRSPTRRGGGPIVDGSEGGDNSGRAVGRSDSRAHRATPAGAAPRMRTQLRPRVERRSSSRSGAGPVLRRSAVQGAADPIGQVRRVVQIAPGPTDDDEPGVADAVLADLLGEHRIPGPLARPEQPSVLLGAVELADGRELGPPEITDRATVTVPGRHRELDRAALGGRAPALR